MLKTSKSKQLPHPVFGGEGASMSNHECRDIIKPDTPGSYAGAGAARKTKTEGLIDNAAMHYSVVHLHRLLDLELQAPRR